MTFYLLIKVRTHTLNSEPVSMILTFHKLHWKFKLICVDIFIQLQKYEKVQQYELIFNARFNIDVILPRMYFYEVFMKMKPLLKKEYAIGAIRLFSCRLLSDYAFYEKRNPSRLSIPMTRNEASCEKWHVKMQETIDISNNDQNWSCQ